MGPPITSLETPPAGVEHRQATHPVPWVAPILVAPLRKIKASHPHAPLTVDAEPLGHRSGSPPL